MSSATATNWINGSSSGFSDRSSRLPSKTLDQNDFLKLLVTQMSAQDPLNPKGDLDMAAQMAQFTSLEQTRTMSGSLTALLGEQQVLQANGLLGRQVNLQADADTTVTGVVDEVKFIDGEPQLIVSGSPYSLSQVLSITPAPVIMS